MKATYKLHDSVGELLDELVQDYDSGKIEGVMVLMFNRENVATNWANMTLLERLGAVEVLRKEFLKHCEKSEEEI